MSEEIWKPIEGYEGKYEISNLGQVRSWRKYGSITPHILKQFTHKNGKAICVSLNDGCLSTSFSITKNLPKYFKND